MADGNTTDGVTIELSAPAGWIKKLAIKEGGTPQKKGIIFVSPTGEEIKSKRKLDMYLKSHPGGPPGSAFDWGTGGSPRRSARLVSKAAGSAPSHSPAKRQKKSNRKIDEEKGNGDEEGEEASAEKEDVGEETKELLEVSNVDAKDPGEEEVVAEDASRDEPNDENGERKPQTEAVTKKTSAPHDVNTEGFMSDKESSAAATSTGDSVVAKSNGTPEVGETTIDEHNVKVIAAHEKGVNAEEKTGDLDDSCKKPADEEVGNAVEMTGNQDNSNKNPGDVQVIAPHETSVNAEEKTGDLDDSSKNPADEEVGNAVVMTGNQDNSNKNPGDVQVISPHDKVGNGEKATGNQDHSNENPAEENAFNQDLSLNEPTTGR